MITAHQLFIKRLLCDYKFQYKVWKLAVDWIIMLYIIAPLLLVGGINYYSWWEEAPLWFEFITMPAIFIVYFLWLCSGIVRWFIDEADQVFLLQNKHWFKALKVRGAIFTSFNFILFGVLLTGLLLPIMVWQLQWNGLTIIALVIFSFAGKLNLAIFKQFIEIKYRKIKYVIMMGLLYLIAGSMYFSILSWMIDHSVLLLSLSIFLCCSALYGFHSRSKTLNGFSKDIQREQKHKMRYLNILLSQTGIVKKQSWIDQKEPWIIRSRFRWFKQRTPQNIMTELCVKIYLRRSYRVIFYLQFTAVSCLAIYNVPLIIQCILGVGTILLMWYWLKLCIDDLMSSTYFKLFKWSFNTTQLVYRNSILILLLPFVIIISLFFVISL